MQRVLVIIALSMFSISMQAQGRTVKSIEQEIERYELKIEEKERNLSRNNANGTTSGNRLLQADIAAYEAQIYSLLKELKQVKHTDRTEVAFMALQQKVDALTLEFNQLKAKVGSCSNENAQLRVEVASLRKQLESGSNVSATSIAGSIGDKEFSGSVVDSFQDARDGEVYKTVRIGNQIWMSENLRYNVSGSYLNPNNRSREYGRLYSWNQALEVCPSGWHLPSEEELKELERSLGMSESDVNMKGYRGDIAGKLKSKSGWRSNINISNSSGFNALPAGRYRLGSFYLLGKYTYFWSSTEHVSEQAWARRLDYRDLEVGRYNYNKTYGLSCRCLKN